MPQSKKTMSFVEGDVVEVPHHGGYSRGVLLPSKWSSSVTPAASSGKKKKSAKALASSPPQQARVVVANGEEVYVDWSELRAPARYEADETEKSSIEVPPFFATVQGLQNATQHNGKRVRLLRFDNDKQRYSVRVWRSLCGVELEGGVEFAVRPRNLVEPITVGPGADPAVPPAYERRWIESKNCYGLVAVKDIKHGEVIFRAAPVVRIDEGTGGGGGPADDEEAAKVLRAQERVGKRVQAGKSIRSDEVVRHGNPKKKPLFFREKSENEASHIERKLVGEIYEKLDATQRARIDAVQDLGTERLGAEIGGVFGKWISCSSLVSCAGWPRQIVAIPEQSFLNHDCSPNATAELRLEEGFDLLEELKAYGCFTSVSRATRDIRPGEEICKVFWDFFIVVVVVLILGGLLFSRSRWADSGSVLCGSYCGQCLLWCLLSRLVCSIEVSC